MRKKLLLARIAELESKLTENEAAMGELNNKNTALTAEKTSLQAIVDEYRAREQSIMTAMTEAGNNAARILDEAKNNAESLIAQTATESERIRSEALSEAEQIKTEAKAEAKAVLDDAAMTKAKAEEDAANVKSAADTEAIRLISEAEMKAKAIISSAEREAGETVSDAKERSSKLLSVTESTAAEYEQTIAAYNAQLEQMAADVTANAERLAAFTRERMIKDTTIVEETKGIHAIPLDDDFVLPDAGDDPAALMRNIYVLQHRDLPEEMNGDGREETEEPLPQTGDAPIADENRPESDNESTETDGAGNGTGEETVGTETPDDGCETDNTAMTDAPPSTEDEEEAPLVSVSDLSPETVCEDQQQNDNATLDELLDEIIRSGELNYGKE